MDIKEVEHIQELIKQAELENAKNEGIIENIKKEWKENYGTDDVEEIKKHLEELEKEYKKSCERLDKLFNDLISSYDWDSLSDKLGD